MQKAWWKSKTLWVNGLAAIALLVQTFTGFVISAEVQAAILVIINVILRVVTSEELGWNDR